VDGVIAAGVTIADGGVTASAGHTMDMVSIRPALITTATGTIPIAATAGGIVTGETMDGAATADGAITVVGDIAGGATTADGVVAIASGV
jgi:hypothetical protein